jgi:hypothetical protein
MPCQNVFVKGKEYNNVPTEYNVKGFFVVAGSDIAAAVRYSMISAA